MLPLSFSHHWNRRSWKAVRAGLLTAGLLASSALGTAAPSQAAPGQAFADALTLPQSGVFVPGALGGHVWLADAVNGFCRVDPQPLGGALLTNCRVDGARTPQQATYDPVRKLVYVADKSTRSQGVAAYTFDPATETLGTVSLITVVPQPGFRPSAVALSSDGNTLYVGFLRLNEIWALNLNTNASSQVGFSADPKRCGEKILEAIQMAWIDEAS